MENWWNLNIEESMHFNPSSWIKVGLVKKNILNEKNPVFSFDSKNLILKVAEKKLHECIIETGLLLVKEDYFQSYDQKSIFYANNDTGLQITLLNNENVDFSFNWATTSLSMKSKLETLFKQISFPREEKAGLIYTLSQDKAGDLFFQPAGFGGIKFEKSNYEPAVITKLEHLIKDLNSVNPCGRLSIFEGDPGTGKTYLIRGLVEELKEEIMFVIIPPNYIARMSEPSIISSLLAILNLKRSKRVVFLLEDADACLLPRKVDNINTISNLLNLSDGILGSICDLRLIATTNAKKPEVDPALMRAGRLCRYIEVGKLGTEQASKVFTRLTGKHKSFAKSISLAEVYFLARDEDNETTTPSENSSVGFSF